MFPLYWTVVTALKPPTAVFEGPTYLPWLDFQPTLQGFREVLGGTRGSMVPPLVNSSLVALSATFVATVLGAMAAYALVRFE
jgi:multiple sugar transport system permease protein